MCELWNIAAKDPVARCISESSLSVKTTERIEVLFGTVTAKGPRNIVAGGVPIPHSDGGGEFDAAIVKLLWPLHTVIYTISMISTIFQCRNSLSIHSSQVCDMKQGTAGNQGNKNSKIITKWRKGSENKGTEVLNKKLSYH